MLLGAYVDQKLVGYKFGYKVNDQKFHSWMGGVLPEYRGYHIATALMRFQEEWAKTNGYKVLTVNTYKEKFPVMYEFLISHGYSVNKEETKSEADKIIHKSYFVKHL